MKTRVTRPRATILMYAAIATLPFDVAPIRSLPYKVDKRGRLTGKKDLRKSLPEVWKTYGFKLAAATLGEEGVLAWDGERFWYAAAYRVNVVDSIGAGDIFHAGFIYGLMRGWGMQRQLDFACAAAALNCMAVGARGGIQRAEKIEELMANGVRYAAAVGV